MAEPRWIMQNTWWEYYITNKQHWAHGFTAKRLAKIEPTVKEDKEFWSDILDRHSGAKYSPEEMMEWDEHTFNHCVGNMTGMLMQLFVEHKIIKP